MPFTMDNGMVTLSTSPRITTFPKHMRKGIETTHFLELILGFTRMGDSFPYLKFHASPIAMYFPREHIYVLQSFARPPFRSTQPKEMSRPNKLIFTNELVLA